MAVSAVIVVINSLEGYLTVFLQKNAKKSYIFICEKAILGVF